MGDSISIYRKIFDLANDNMKKHGEAFRYSYKAFSVFIGKSPNLVHTDEFFGLDKEDYLAALYLRCLNRLPDEGSYKTYENVEKETKDFMQYMVLSGVIQSAEFMTLNKKVTGIREFRRNWKKNRHYSRAQILRLQVQSVKAKCFGSLVIPIWVKMPNSIRNIVRRITGRKRKPE